MYNIIRSLNFTNRRNMAILLTIISMITLPLLIPMFVLNVPFKDITGGAYFTNLCGELFTIWIFPIMIISCIAASADAGDKTIYYEIMAGHSRSRIFFARIISALVWGVLLCAVTFYLPLVYYGFINGWPVEGIKISDIILRCLLSLLPMFRIAAFCIMVSVVFRSAGKGIGFSYLFIEVEVLIIEITSEFIKTLDKTYLSGLYNVMDLLTLDNSRNFVINGEKVDVYETAVSGKYALMTIAISLIIGGIYLTVAYLDFTKRDRN